MNQVSILSWNIRGINNSVAKRNFKDYIFGKKISIFCLQETKCENVLKQGSNFIQNLGSFKCSLQPSSGLSGGLITGWNLNLVQCVALTQSSNWIWNSFKSTSGEHFFHVVNVYSPQSLDRKRVLWEDLRSILDCIGEEAVCFLGDFNCVRSSNERFNCEYRKIETREFNDWISDCNLAEVHISNARYTWFGEESKKSKLDRVLVNYIWSVNRAWEVQSLSKKHSDHKPLLFHIGVIRSDPKPFRVFNCHPDNSLFDHIREKILQNQEWGNLDLHKSIRAIRFQIKDFTKDFKSKMVRDIENLEHQMEVGENLDNPGKAYEQIRGKLMELYDKRESMLQQKSRVDWLSKGDGNNKFFHQAIQKRINSNTISRVLWEGKWLVNADQIRNAFFNHYSLFFKDSNKRVLSLGSLYLPRLTDDAKISLVQNISPEEILAALHSLADNKAPGPDGMNIKCLKFLWPMIGKKIVNFVHNFCDTGFVPGGLNSSFIALIPKIPCPSSVRDYRPISLINSSIKILLKVLATRLAGHLDALISDTQTGFIKGRQASESILLVKEVSHSIQKRRCGGSILKLDFEKAFDTVNWDFLVQVMDKMNFDPKWCRWIIGLWESIRVSVLVNGTPSQEFSPQRGLRQGDPISPLLFNLAGEVLNSMLTVAAKKGIFKGIKLSKNADYITHLQFADDTVVFLDGTLESAKGVKQVLQCFQLVSGLKINYGKSSLYSAYSSSGNFLEEAEILNCNIGSWPMIYLGIPIGCSARRKVFWEPLVRKVKNKLSKWKADSLNKAGRLTLVKSVLDSVPVYWMGIHSIPSSVINKLEQIRRDFFWGRRENGSNQARKLHLIAWDQVCKPKCMGGLGLMPIKLRNYAMLGKWHYRWVSERDRSWNRWIRGKYNLQIGSNIYDCSSCNFLSDSMKDILKVLNIPALQKNVNPRNFAWKLKDGKSIMFWDDLWIGDGLLKENFKKLFQISARKESSVYDFLIALSGSSILDSSFWCRPLRAWEAEEAKSLELLVKKCDLSTGQDVLIWTVSKSSYSVSKATMLLVPQGMEVSWKFIWKLKIPHKIKIFLWKVHLNIFPTNDFLVTRGILSESQIGCNRYKKFPESSHHLFFGCVNNMNLWDSIASWWRIKSIPVNDLCFQALWSQAKCFPTKLLRSVWKVVISSALWSIWLSRNRIVFEEENTSHTSLMNLVQFQSKEWCVAFSLIHADATTWWLSNPVGAVSSSTTFKLKELALNGPSLTGFIDGSWKAHANSFQAGIGGFIQDKKGNIIFTFSGPIAASNPFEAEWKALEYMVQSFLNSPWRHVSLVIHTDSRNVICKFLEKVSLCKVDEKQDWNYDARQSNIGVNFVPSEFNFKADSLAKKGAKGSRILSFWVQSLQNNLA